MLTLQNARLRRAPECTGQGFASLRHGGMVTRKAYQKIESFLRAAQTFRQDHTTGGATFMVRSCTPLLFGHSEIARPQFEHMATTRTCGPPLLLSPSATQQLAHIEYR